MRLAGFFQAFFRNGRGRPSEREKRSEVLTTIYKSILSAETIDESIYSTLQAFREHFTFERVSIALFDFEHCTFTPYGISSRPGLEDHKEGTSFPLELFPLLHILLQHKTCLVQDLKKKENLSPIERNAMEKEGIRSYFLCPLIGKGELLGSLNFGSKVPEAFSRDTVNFCLEVANAIAISLHQFNLQEKIRSINFTLERKEKNITDSINYAKRIQEAKLPASEIIRSCAPDSFVLFKPKDIVSGDFYYFRKHKGAVFVASADCTGHGVPGALMSMLCSEHLDDAISLSADTSVILNQVNRKIRHSLQQSDNDATRDGMDIALCTIDVSNYLVKFAGANRPLWIIRNGATTIEEIKGTKKSIGGLTDDNQNFDTHWIKLRPGDQFYLATDGYADTFGGKTNKKLMTRRLKELLLSIKDLSMEDQHHQLDDFIENWKAGLEQVDDILLIGVRM